MKSVVIIGAGPAGLVAAKTFLHTKPAELEIKILEQQDRVGGMWAVQKGDPRGKVDPEMPTNLSRFTVAFSDLSWNSVDLDDGSDSENRHIPMFPKAWQVGNYLETYRRRYIPEEVLHLNSRVTKVEKVLQGGADKWKVEYESTLDPQSQGASKSSETHCSFHDFLVVGSGFFSSPRPLKIDYSEGADNLHSFPPRTLHSSEFRHLSYLLPDGLDEGGNIVVVGGGISGSEAAAKAAFQISNAKYGAVENTKLGNQKVYHVLSRPFYCLPRYLPQDPYSPNKQDYNIAPTFLPLDACMYNLTRRPAGPITPAHGRMPPERALKSHQYIRSMLGGDQRDLGYPELVYNQQQQEYPSYTGIVDTYSEFVRSKTIIPVRGRVSHMGTSSRTETDSGTPIGFVKATGDPPWDLPGQPETTISNVNVVICATGFTPHTSIDWLPSEVHVAMERSLRSHRLPLLLQRYSIFNDNAPNIAFVGFYEGPFWGVMEMQARLIHARWSQTGEESVPVAPSATVKESQDELLEMRNLRDAMSRQLDDVPQFWMNDYVGLMEACARELGIQRDDAGWGERQGPCTAARYTNKGTDRQESDMITRGLRNMVDDSVGEGRFVAAAVFRAMQGAWILRRKLDSRLPGFPSGTFKGTAKFFPRSSTDPDFTSEYLYIEEGTLKTDTGLILQANRRYVYRYNEKLDKISAWFVKEDGRTVDYFFNEMEFQMPSTETDSKGKGWLAKGSHLCEEDMYESSYEFRFAGSNLQNFGITYQVKGPKKDYTSEAWYER
ncbi:FAD/NAD(P)-binding domain-containing protein [Lophium mytilinum]|uniref:FAD/NAD(P)-binding domain-containing protein n=1 Tax=Lophium mytilinum TaxID=390894 RepID=A0A6A6R5T3_9PEZI|nr:FAD/NAD(P)-binding domain-containing protein [Lophium mytilinum]